MNHPDGIRTVSAHIFHDVDTDAAARRLHLLRVRELGRAFPARPLAASRGGVFESWPNLRRGRLPGHLQSGAWH